MTPGTAGVSVVIPCRNEERYLGQLLASLQHQEVPPQEVIVVDGGSSDRTVEIVRANQKQISYRLILLERPGVAIPEALNAGIHAASGAMIIRLDAHSTPAANYIAAALPHLADANVGVIGGLWVIAPGASTTTARAIAAAVAHPLGAGGAAYRVGQHLRSPIDTDSVPFGCYRKQLWTELGGYDESLSVNEDYDFNFRVRQTNRRVVLDPAIQSTYYARPTLRALANQYFRYGWWKAQMLRMHPASLRWRQALPMVFVGSLIGLAALGLAIPASWNLLGAMVLLYALTLGATAVGICAREGGWSRCALLCCAFATVHLCWGGGALVNMVTGARWPFGGARSSAGASARFPV